MVFYYMPPLANQEPSAILSGVIDMGYKVMYKGLEVICETPQDVDALAERNDGAAPKGRRSNRKHKSVRKLMREIGQPQRELITTLVTAPEPLSDKTLRESLSLDNNKRLAGVLAGISKRAKNAGIEVAIVSKTHFRNGTAERHYRYEISSDVLEEVKAGLGIQG